jgi:hypothetical protein
MLVSAVEVTWKESGFGAGSKCIRSINYAKRSKNLPNPRFEELCINLISIAAEL